MEPVGITRKTPNYATALLSDGKVVHKKKGLISIKRPAYKYIGLCKDGYMDICAQIHCWHDSKHLTVEYLPYLDMAVWISMGQEPSFTPIEVLNTLDIDLDALPEGYDSCALHYTWLTVARDFLEAERHFEMRQPQSGNTQKTRR